MRTAIVVSALLGAVSAIPRDSPTISPQPIPWLTSKRIGIVTFANATATPTSNSSSVTRLVTRTPFSHDHSATATAQALNQRQIVNLSEPCAPQPIGGGPVPESDSVDGFMKFVDFYDMVRSARAPLDYDLVFFNETGSTLDTENYLGYRTLQSYNVSQCAEECDSKANCTSFNIYFERDPSLNPDKDAGCANPASLTNIKCSWWASTISVSTANNTGETRVGFQIAVTGSNGYVKSITPSMLAGYTSPVRLASYIYGASSQQHMIGAGDYFSGVTNPYYCAFACDVITREAKQLGDLTYRPCNYFNSWESTDNDNGSKGLVCYYYDQPQLASDGVGPEDQAKVKNSYAWSRDPQDPGEQF